MNDQILTPGMRLASRYKLDRLVGSGGQGHIWKAMDEVLGRSVAIKVMQDRHEKEAKAASRIRSPHVVTIYDIGEEARLVWISMEWLDGESLRSRLEARGGRLDLLEAAPIIAQVAEGLSAAHWFRVVHRDLKPSNIFLSKTRPQSHIEVIKVLDFGSAKLPSGWSDGESSGIPPASPQYMAPEILRQKPSDERSDIYSFAVTAYEILAGRRPYFGETFSDVLTAWNQGAPPLISSLVPQLPKELDEVFRMGLALDPNDRFAKIEDMAEVFAAIVSSFQRSRLAVPVITGLPRASLGSIPPPLVEPPPRPSSPELPVHEPESRTEHGRPEELTPKRPARPKGMRPSPPEPPPMVMNAPPSLEVEAETSPRISDVPTLPALEPAIQRGPNQTIVMTAPIAATARSTPEQQEDIDARFSSSADHAKVAPPQESLPDEVIDDGLVEAPNRRKSNAIWIAAAAVLSLALIVGVAVRFVGGDRAGSGDAATRSGESGVASAAPLVGSGSSASMTEPSRAPPAPAVDTAATASATSTQGAPDASVSGSSAPSTGNKALAGSPKVVDAAPADRPKAGGASSKGPAALPAATVEPKPVAPASPPPSSTGKAAGSKSLIVSKVPDL